MTYENVLFFSCIFKKREKKNKRRKPQTTVLSPLPFRVMTTLCAGAPVCLSAYKRRPWRPASSSFLPIVLHTPTKYTT